MKVLRALAKLAGADSQHGDDALAKADDPADDPDTTEQDENEPEGGLALRFVLPPDDPDEP